MASGSSRRARLIPQSLLSGPESPTEMELRKLPQTSYDSVEIHGHIDNVTWESFLSQDAGFYESDTSTPPTPTLDLKPLSEHSCRFCPFEGKTLKSLTRHVWTVHKNKREFFCPISGCRGNTIGWLREDLRNRHMSTRHRGQWPEKDASSGDKKGRKPLESWHYFSTNNVKGVTLLQRQPGAVHQIHWVDLCCPPWTSKTFHSY